MRDEERDVIISMDILRWIYSAPRYEDFEERVDYLLFRIMDGSMDRLEWEVEHGKTPVH